MPLKWNKGRNPYLHNFFRQLQVGPSTPKRQMAAQAQELQKKLKAKTKLTLGDHELDEHDIGHASTEMRKPEVVCHELLLVHNEPPKAKGELDSVCAEIKSAAVLGDIPESQAPPMTTPVAITAFVPAPRKTAVAPPPLESLGLVEADDTDDLSLDIVFDH